MRRGLTGPDPLAPDPLAAESGAHLDARLEPGHASPVAVALSGGGDSLALLHLAAHWCARAHRPLLALTVDHGLSPASAGWTARAAAMAAAAGASWRGLAWDGPKPGSGLPAAARRARHALLAEAAREAGAAVVLLAHTADDVAETEALRRGEAPGIGRLRPWAPSPAWPEGRGVFLLRPLLDVGRHDLRRWLSTRGLAWIDDPANADGRSARARVRAAGPLGTPQPGPEPPPGFGRTTPDGRVGLPRRAFLDGEPGARRSLAAALACAAGRTRGASGAALTRLAARLGRPGEVTATLGGARVAADAERVEVGRELGRRPPPDLPLAPGAPAVWDGRWEVAADEPGWAAGAAAGRLSRLSPAAREALQALPAAARSSAAVFVRGAEVRLAQGPLRADALAGPRFDAAVGRVATEADLHRIPPDGRDARTSPCGGTTPAAGSWR